MAANDYLLIIDGSSLLSTQYYGNLPREVLFAKEEEEKAKYYHKIMQTSEGVYVNGVYGFLKTLLNIIKKQTPAYIAVCWDLTRDTFRREIYSDYKGQRKATPLPLKCQFELCQKTLENIGIKQFSSMDYEADDYAGTLSKMFEDQVPVRIMTKDHDYLQLIDENVNLWMMTSSKAKAAEFYKNHRLNQEDFVAPENACYLTTELATKEYGFPPEKTVFMKALAGDTADNIPGVKGVGEKAALPLVNAYDSLNAMYEELMLANISGKDALEELKNKWKDLGIARPPFKALLAESDEELVGKHGAEVSYELATIKRDIELDIKLEELKTCLNTEGLENTFNSLEIHSLSYDDIGADYIDKGGVSKVSITGVRLKKSEYDDLLSEIKECGQAGISIKYSDAKAKFTPKQLSFDDLFAGAAGNNSDANQTTSGSSENVARSNNPCDADHFNIDSIAVAVNEDKFYELNEEDFSQSEMLDFINQVYSEDIETVSFDIKSQLFALSSEKRDGLMASEKGVNAFDIMIAAYLLNPLKSKYDINEIIFDYLGGGAGELSENSDKVNPDGILAAEYISLKQTLEKKLEAYSMLKLFRDIEMPMVFVLYDLEYQGVRVERDLLKQYGDSLIERINELSESIVKACGHEFNLNSPKQLGTVLFEEMGLPHGKKTKTGYSTNVDVLEELSKDYPFVADILEYRGLVKLHSTYAEGLANFISEDGRIHGTFNQTVTATGRISSTEPNLQNIPMRTELGRAIRKVFLPKDGTVFVDADYSQIELRIMAHVSGDEKLINAYREGRDIHRSTASEVFKVPYDEVSDNLRRNAKAVNFGIIYGMSAHGLSEDLKISRTEAKDYIESYYATYPSIKTYLDGEVKKAHDQGYVTTLSGRIRPIPEIKSGNFNQRSFGERVAMNSPIQGTAADIMKLAMIRTSVGLIEAHLKSRMVLTIHDEIVIECYREELEQVKKILSEAMTGAYDMAVDLDISMAVGENWYEAK